MTRRRGKSSNKQDVSWLPLETPAGQSSRGFNEYVIPGVLLLIMAVGGAALSWVCSDHQQAIESLTETLVSMQARITNLQQQLGTDNAQLASVGDFEERLVALEDAYNKAQRQVELALATSEQIKSKDLQSKMWSLQTEMNDKMAELQQNSISIAALNAIVKNKSVEIEFVKQSVNTMLGANTELAMQISGVSSTLSVTKLHLDEQIFVVDGLMSQLEGQKREINEIKAIFTSNQESFAANTQELMDIKELLETEQIKRTQKLEKQLRSLYKRLDDHQTNTESLHFHLAAQLEALQIQQPSRAEEELQVNELVTTTDDKKRKAPKKELENTEDEEFSGERGIREEDKIKEEDRFNRKQAAVIDAEASEWSVKEPVSEIQTPSEGQDIGIEEGVIEEQKEVDITEEGETLQEAYMVTNEMKETVVDELQAALEDYDSEEQIGVLAAEEIQTLLEESSSTSIETEEAAVEKQVGLTPAQEMQTGSEETEELPNIIKEIFREEHAEHAAEEMHKVSNEISTAKDVIHAEQGSGAVTEEIQIPSDEADNVDNQMRDVIPAEIEQKAGSAKESLVSENSEV